MKRVFKYLALSALAVFSASCIQREELSFKHEDQAFQTQPDKILVEVIMPQASATTDDIYIIGAFNGGEESIGDPVYRMVHSETITSKWGIYVDPSMYVGGKTLADGFTFYNSQQGYERSSKGEPVTHTLTIGTGEWANVYADKWEKYFLPPDPDAGKIVLPDHDGVRVYIIDETGWDAIALYMWGDVNNYGGDWPGAAVSGTVTLGTQQYKYFEYGDDIFGLNENLIFNNNGDGVQLDDYNMTFTDGVADYFLLVTAESVTAAPNPAEGGAIVIPDHDGVRVWVDDQTTWDAIALYMWGDVNNFGGDWPGAQVAGSETLGDVEYKYFEYEDDIFGLSENLIFNNNDGGSQLDDVNVTFTEGVKDYFFQVTDEGATLVDGPGGGIPTPPTPPAPVYDGPKIYIQNNTTWEGNLFAHYWIDGANTEWPGQQFEETETVEGVEFQVISTLDKMKGQKIGIILHSDVDEETNRVQTEITLDTDRYYVLTNDGLTEVEMGVRIIVKDESGWPGTIYAHIWDDEENATEWPGIKATGGYFDADTYLVFLTPKVFKGKTVDVIFHSDENDNVNRYQTKITLDKDRFYVLSKEFNFVEEEKKPVTIYVEDKTGWDEMALYLWGEVNNLGGNWPGNQVARTETIMGTTYKVFVIPDALGRKEVLIFNNNNNGVQLDNYPDDSGMLLDKEEYFFIVTGEGVTPTERPTIDPTKRVTIYVDDQTGWEAMALYMYGDVNNLGGDWPGVQPGEPVTVAEKEYKTFVIENALGLSENLIFNNNNGGTQLGDYALTFEKNVYWLKVTAEGVTQIEDPTVVKVCVDDQTGWEAIALYMWGDVNNLGGGWPGILPSETEVVGEVTYKVFVIQNAIGLSENLIFNNNGGGTQLADYALKFEKNKYYLKVTDTGVTPAN